MIFSPPWNSSTDHYREGFDRWGNSISRPQRGHEQSILWEVGDLAGLKGSHLKGDIIIATLLIAQYVLGILLRFSHIIF